MKNFTKAQKQAAKNLVVSYAAYIATEDGNAVRVWGRMLLEDQEITGVEMVLPETIEKKIAASMKAA